MYYSKSSLEHLRLRRRFLLFHLASDLPSFFPKRLTTMLRLSKEEMESQLPCEIQGIQPSQNDMFVSSELWLPHDRALRTRRQYSTCLPFNATTSKAFLGANLLVQSFRWLSVKLWPNAVPTLFLCPFL